MENKLIENYEKIILRPRKYNKAKFLVNGSFITDASAVSSETCKLLDSTIGDTIVKLFIHSDEESNRLTIPIISEGFLADSIQHLALEQKINLRVEFVFGVCESTLKTKEAFRLLEIL